MGKAVSPKSPKDEATPEEQNGSEANDKSSKIKTWLWFPTLSDLRTHFLHELGFLACLVQLFAASIFWISGLTALPGIFNHLSPGLEAGIYWTPQVIGGTGFHHFGNLVHVRDPGEMVATRVVDTGLAHWLLEHHWRIGIRALPSIRI